MEKVTKIFTNLATVLAGLVAITLYGSATYAAVKYFGLGDAIEKSRMNPSFNLWYMAGLLFYIIGAFVVMIQSAGYTEDRVRFKLNQWLHKQAEALMPVLYECQNNGVSVLITTEQREQALRRMRTAGGNIMLVPDAMVFTADDHFYPIRLDSIRTGNWADMKCLVEGCAVKSDSIHVNYSSFNMVDKTYQCANFRPPKFAEAKRWVELEKAQLARMSWLRRNTFYAALFGFVLTILAFGLGMIATFTLTKTVLFVASGVSLATVLWAVRRLNSLPVR